jgi:hypothetical protein
MKLTDYKLTCGLFMAIAIALLFTTMAESKDVTGYIVDSSVNRSIIRQHYENVTSTTTLEFDFLRDMGVPADKGWIKNNGSIIIYASPNYTFDNNSTMNGIPIPGGAYYKFADEDPVISNLRVVPRSGNLNINVEASR